MAVYIPDMEMPDYGYVCIKVFANGDVVMTKEKRGGLVITGLNEHIGMAIPVPKYEVTLKELVDGAPTVIPADDKDINVPIKEDGET